MPTNRSREPLLGSKLWILVQKQSICLGISEGIQVNFELKLFHIMGKIFNSLRNNKRRVLNRLTRF